ncbi:MAG: threonine synthase [Anaerolineales bacterium]
MDYSPKTSTLTHLECPECRREFDADVLRSICHRCNSPLLARYDLDAVSQYLTPGDVRTRPPGLWRWSEILPLRQLGCKVTLGEGDTPIFSLPRLGKYVGISNLFVKDESRNPTGTFKARGLSVAVSRALELGVNTFVIPTAGNAGAALAAYAARAGCRAHVFMPRQSDRSNQAEVRLAGANLVLVEGSISKAAIEARSAAAAHSDPDKQDINSNWFDMSTFKEPYRLEGKKTMGLEIAEYFGWQLPDVIVYPTGGGTGLVGMWKAFGELFAMGWINERFPRMVAVQTEACPPIVRAFQENRDRVNIHQDAQTIANGLRVPEPFADRLILDTIYASQGYALAVSDEQIKQASKQLAQLEGILAAFEGSATLAALMLLRDQGRVKDKDKVLLMNTGSGLKTIL